MSKFLKKKRLFVVLIGIFVLVTTLVSFESGEEVDDVVLVVDYYRYYSGFF
jgi:hypothetical protein